MDKQVWLGKLLNKKIIFYLIVNRVVLFIGTYFLAISDSAQKSVPFKSFLDFFLTFGKRWDGNSYTFIASHGYVLSGPEKNFIVFPPFYPLFIKALTLLNINLVLSGILVSNFFYVLGMLVFYKLLRIDYDKKFSFLVILLMSIFPTSFFFSVAYPESLFLFLFSGSFYLARKRLYLYAGCVAGLAAITRPFGIILAPALFVQLLINKDLNVKNFLYTFIPFLIPPAYYLFLNYILFNNPFAFLTFLKETWNKSFDFPWQGIISSWKRGVQSSDSFSYKYFVGYGEAIASTLGFLSILAGLKKWGLKSSYLIYITLGVIFFTSTSFILSAPRYLLSIPPFFILFTHWIKTNRFIKVVWITISVILLFYISKEFAWGRWTF